MNTDLYARCRLLAAEKCTGNPTPDLIDAMAQTFYELALLAEPSEESERDNELRATPEN